MYPGRARKVDRVRQALESWDPNANKPKAKLGLLGWASIVVWSLFLAAGALAIGDLSGQIVARVLFHG